MLYSEVERIFNRSCKNTLSKKKFFFIFLTLIACGVLIVFCRALSFGAHSWVSLSLVFLPIFLCAGILLAMGVLLNRIYYHEVKGQPIELRKIFGQSLQLLVGVAYLTLPLILGYISLWTLLGVFYLIQEIPAIGGGVAVLFSFGPFLLVLGCLLLSIASLLILFFVTPYIAIKNSVKIQIAQQVIAAVKNNALSYILLFSIALIPLLLCVGLLTLAAVMTGLSYLPQQQAIGTAMQWFFIMLPFCLVMTPFISFFFNFSLESYSYMQRKMKLVDCNTEQKESTKEEVSCMLQ